MNGLDLKMINPFVRCVGLSVNIFQTSILKAYDHRILYILEGNADILLNNESYFAEKYDLFFIAPGIPYRVHYNGNLKMIVINFDWTQEKSFINQRVDSELSDLYRSEQLIEQIELNEMFELNSSFYIKNMHILRDKMVELLTVFENKNIFDDIILSGNLKAIAGIIAEYNRYKDKKILKTRKLADDIKTYLQEHYTGSLDNKAIAQHFKYHPSYINRIINIHTGMSIHKYILNYRLTKALSLLENFNLSIEQISDMTGFCDTKHFSKSFRKLFGKSPSQIRYSMK